MASDTIVTRLLSVVPTNSGEEAAAPPSDQRNQSLEQWSDDLECQLLTGVQKFHKEDPTATTTSSCSLKEAADALHISILREVAPSRGFKEEGAGSGWEDDSDANEATMDVAESLLRTTAISDSLDLALLASLLRATGLFLRWSAAEVTSQQQQSQSSSENNHGLLRLKSKAMLLLYAKLLDMEINVVTTPTSESPDVPRYAAICLFRATYGDDATTTTARHHFINSLNGCSYLMGALLKGDQPVSRLFSVVRNVHHLIAASPECIPKMEKALESLLDVDNDHENAGQNMENKEHCLSEVLVATLAWAYRSEPTFPGNKSDRRPDLVLELLRAMYVLGSNPTISPPRQDVMTQIGIILCELLQFSNADERMYQIKLAVAALLLNAPKEYSHYLVDKGGIKPLVDIMAYQTSLVVVERRGSSAEDAAAVVPILLVLLKLTQANESALNVVKEEVFPPHEEASFQQMATEEIAKGKTEGKINAKNMAPLDAPKGTLRWRLIRLMTWTESNVKRAACELLYVLCGQDSTQFVLRTGFGNAIHFLGIRGFVNLPAGVDI